MNLSNLLFWKKKRNPYEEEPAPSHWRSNHINPISKLSNDLPTWFKKSKTEAAYFSYSKFAKKKNSPRTFIWIDGVFRSDWTDYQSTENCSCVWLNGKFEGQTFRGDWTNGVFLGKDFNGTWQNGTFSGERFFGAWYKGTFERGSCYNCNWIDGHFKGNLFQDGTWHNGHFYCGIFLRSCFINGQFGYGKLIRNQECLFKDSVFVNGKFMGTFENGILSSKDYRTHFHKSAKWTSQELDKKLALAAVAGITFDENGYATAYRKTRAEGKGCYDPSYIQKEGPFSIEDAAPPGEGTCQKGIHVCSSILALTYFAPQFGDILWEVKFHKDDLMDCDGQKARLKKGTAKQIPWNFLSNMHPINYKEPTIEYPPYPNYLNK